MSSLTVIKKLSHNYNSRPYNCNIDMVVIHYTDLFSLSATLDYLSNLEKKVSAHYLIDTDGKIFQLVEEFDRAWHAGVSSWDGESNINDRSIGIEIQNAGESFFNIYGFWPPYTKHQINVLTYLVKQIMSKYAIGLHRIVGHNHIAPNRKKDPGPHFNWKAFKNKLSYFKR